VKRAGVLSTLIVAGALSLATGSRAQPSTGPKVVELQKLRDNLYLLSGGGGNSAAFITDLGVVLVDTKLAGWGQPLLDKLKTVTTKPVTTIINTHAHPDHTGSNEFFPTSVEIIAQENTRLNMDKLEDFKGVKVNYLPKLMFKEKMTIGSGKDRVDLYYHGAGHTRGDAWVVFPSLRVMHAGDMMESRQLPAIDLDNGGSGLAFPDTLARAAAAAKNVDTIIPGHGPLMTMKEIEEYAQFNRDFRDATVSGFNHGLSISEVADAWKVPDRYRGYTAMPERVKTNVQAIFSELTRTLP
jgi:glyoxylase-like metal-dependent hydrolase (beta-lactamase superfamily II)